jgi:seryl-tRNA synthetase
MDWSEVIQERLAAESPVGGDVSEEALRRGWVFPFAEGQYVYGAEWTGLVRRLQELLLAAAADHGFREYMFPRLIPAEAARNFQLSQFNPFLLWNVGENNAKVLDPVQCLAFYEVLRGRRFRADDLPLKIVETLGGWTWRRERPERLDGMFRAVEYARVEHVWLATPSQSQDIRNKMCDSLVDLLTELGLSARTVVGKPCLPLQSFEDRTEAATSADHVPGIDIELLVRPPQSPDSITPGRYAVTPDGFDEVGGCTIEGDHHLSSFDIGRDDGGPLSSGCCGIGLNRVVIAFLFQHGFVRSHWPDLIARRMDAALR